METRRRITISVHPCWVDEIDELRGNMPRSVFIERAVAGALHTEDDDSEVLVGYA